MADKSTRLVLNALSHALSEPGGLPLHGSKAAPGLFPASSLGKAAAQRCLDEGWLHVVSGEAGSKPPRPRCALTEKGRAFLLDQLNPRQVLEDLVRAVEARQVQLRELVEAARQSQADLASFRACVEAVLQKVAAGGASRSPAAGESIRDELDYWHAAGATDDCPLPELYRRVQITLPELTLGQFHDELRRLHDEQQIYLHPWTGPMCDLPEPSRALLVGHEIAYYASLRTRDANGAARMPCRSSATLPIPN